MLCPVRAGWSGGCSGCTGAKGPWLSLRLCAPRESGPEAHSWRRPSETPEAAQDGYRGEQCQGRANGPGPRTPKGLGSRWGKGTPDAGVPRGRAPRYATPLRSRDTRGNGVEFLWAHPKMADKREAQLSGLLCLGAAGLCPGLLELLPPPAGPAGRPRPSGPPTAPTDRPRCPAPLQGNLGLEHSPVSPAQPCCSLCLAEARLLPGLFPYTFRWMALWLQKWQSPLPLPPPSLPLLPLAA